MKKLEIDIFDLVVKINIRERREVLIYDLHKRIDVEKLSHNIRL